MIVASKKERKKERKHKNNEKYRELK